MSSITSNAQNLLISHFVHQFCDLSIHVHCIGVMQEILIAWRQTFDLVGFCSCSFVTLNLNVVQCPIHLHIRMHKIQNISCF
jgi:hypothetical protein